MTSISVAVMMISGIVGFFAGITFNDAFGGAILFSMIAGIACIIYTIEHYKR